MKEKTQFFLILLVDRRQSKMARRGHDALFILATKRMTRERARKLTANLWKMIGIEKISGGLLWVDRERLNNITRNGDVDPYDYFGVYAKD